jgi:hypothetical protein
LSKRPRIEARERPCNWHDRSNASKSVEASIEASKHPIVQEATKCRATSSIAGTKVSKRASEQPNIQFFKLLSIELSEHPNDPQHQTSKPAASKRRNVLLSKRPSIEVRKHPSNQHRILETISIVVSKQKYQSETWKPRSLEGASKHPSTKIIEASINANK